MRITEAGLAPSNTDSLQDLTKAEDPSTQIPALRLARCFPFAKSLMVLTEDLQQKRRQHIIMRADEVEMVFQGSVSLVANCHLAAHESRSSNCALRCSDRQRPNLLTHGAAKLKS